VIVIAYVKNLLKIYYWDKKKGFFKFITVPPFILDNNGYGLRRSWDVYVLNEEGVHVAAGTRDEQKRNLVIVTTGEVAGIVKGKTTRTARRNAKFSKSRNVDWPWRKTNSQSKN